MARRRTLYLPVMIAAALAVLGLTLVVAPAAMAQPASVEGESFTHPRGTAVVHDQMYSGGAALKFNKSKAVATKQVTISEPSTVLVRARADQKKGGSPTLDIQVDGENSGTRRITSSALADYNYPAVTLQPGTHTIGLKGGSLAPGRNVFVDVVTFPVVAPPPPPDPGRVYFSTKRFDGVDRIVSVKPDGSDMQRLLNNDASSPAEWYPAISPDGSKVAYVNPDGVLHVVGTDGSGAVSTDAGVISGVGIYGVSWVDNDTLIYHQETSFRNTSILTRDADLQTPGQIVVDIPGSNDYNPVWTSDSIYWSNNGTQIYKANHDGSNIALVTDGGDFAVSPDETKLAYIDRITSHLIVSNIDGTNKQDITPNIGGEVVTGVDWSLDGNYIAFSRQDGDIYRINADGTGAIGLTRDGATFPPNSTADQFVDWGSSPTP